MQHLRSPAGPLSSALVFLLVTLAYSLLALSAYELFGALSIGVTFFPPAGLTFASFLLLPRRLWPAVAAGIVVGEVMVDMGQGQGFWWSIGWAAANTVEPFVGAMVTRQLCPAVAFTRRFVAAFLVGGLVVGPAVGASIGSTVLNAADDLEWLSAFPDIWVGDALGVLVVAPLILVLARPEAFLPDRPSVVDAVFVAGAMVVAGTLLFFADDIPVGYAVIPLLAVTAVRYSPREVSIAAVVVAGALTAATANGRGPWASAAGGDAQRELVQQQAFLLVAIAGAWFLKLEVTERLRAVRAAQVSELQLERAIEETRQRRGVAAMYEALSDLAGATTTAEVIELLPAHAEEVLGARATLTFFDDRRAESDDPLDVAARTGRPVFATQALDDRSATGDRGADTERTVVTGNRAALPLNVGGLRRGVLELVRPEERPWSYTARMRAMAFASIVDDALERTGRSEHDHQVALTLQRALMPDTILAPPGLRAAGRYLPATRTLEVGGDWYELISSPEGVATVVIGDVVGHSVHAAAAMGKLAAAAKALGYAGNGPAELVRCLDQVAAHTPDAMMTTMVCADVDPGSGIVTYANAGHPPPLLRDPEGKVTDLDGALGAPLAVSDGDRLDETIVVRPRSLVVFYTDGLIERRDAAIDDRLDLLRETLEGLADDDPVRACSTIVEAMLGERAHDDDVALLCVAFDGP
jgi:serine phosphatase RsbU (regulator of sigma subunit)/integral membrane sensor domain MASE1